MILNSLKNPKFKLWKSLLTTKGIKKNNLALVCGRKIISEVLNNQTKNIQSLLVSEKMNLNGFISKDDLENLKNKNYEFKVEFLSNALFKELDALGTHAPLVITKINALNEYDFNEKINIVDKNSKSNKKTLSLFCALSDPLNLGALIRSSIAFEVTEIILLRESAHPYLPKVIRNSVGSVFKIPLFKGPSIHELPLNQDFLALDLNGDVLNQDYKWPQQTKLLLGEEGQGVPKQFLKNTLKISMSNQLESLNATVAASLVLNQWWTQSFK